MVDRIPPRKKTKVNVVVAGWTKGQPEVELNIKNAGGANGNATINGKATLMLKKSKVVKLKGTTQTSPGNGGKLQLEARQGGNLLATSNHFSVSAIPENWGGTLASKISTGSMRGVIVNDKWKSDSGQVGDLSQVWISEEVERKSKTGVYKPRNLRVSGYLGPAVSFSRDTLADQTHFMTGKGKAVDHQTSIFWDKRTGSKDIGLKNSGYVITAEVGEKSPGKFWHRMFRKGGSATANGHPSQSGSGTIDSGKQDV